MHMYIVTIAIFAQSIWILVYDIVLLSAMDAQMQQGESSSDDMYEEVEEVVRTICGNQLTNQACLSIYGYMQTLTKDTK